MENLTLHYMFGLMFTRWQSIVWSVCNFFSRKFFNLQVLGGKNIENLPAGGVVFIANHSGIFDPFFIGASIPSSYIRRIKAFRQMARSRQIRHRPYGPFIWAMGAYSVKRCGGDYARSLRKTIELLRDGQAVLMFPTGRIIRDFQPTDARPGVAYLAKKINPLFVPVFIGGAYKISLKDLWKRNRKVAVKFGRPFYSREVADPASDLRQTAAGIMSRVKALADKLQ